MDSVDVHVLLNCPRDGFVENRELFGLMPGADATFHNSKMQCPGCGQVVPIVDARYEADRRGRVTRTVGTRSGPSQRERIEILRSTVAWAQEQLASPDADVELVAAKLEDATSNWAQPIARGLARVRESFRNDPAGWVAIILTLLIWWTSQQDSVSADDVQRMIEEAIQQIPSSSEVSPVPPPSEPPPPATSIPTPRTR